MSTPPTLWEEFDEAPTDHDSMSQSVYEKQHGQTYIVEGPKSLSASIQLTIEVSDYL